MARGRTPFSGCVLLLAAVTLCPAAGLIAAPPAAQPPAPSGGRPPGARPPDQEGVFFESRVRPLLVERCYGCHAGKTVQGGLRLDRPQGLPAGESGAAVVPGKPAESRLIQAVRYGDPRLQMPPTGKLSDPEIRILEQWVEAGAVWPAGGVPRSAFRVASSEFRVPSSQASARGASTRNPEPGTRNSKPHWAFQPLRTAEPPRVRNGAWCRARIDRYVLAKLEDAGLAPAPPADARTLIRRLSFDLTGLPPSPEEVEAFVRECAEEKACEHLVDRLLASPHYGERWGRHWLDLARYCDLPEAWAQTDAQAWLYRDWVVRALNEDMPYDRFVRLQLAADELPDAAPPDLAALGFMGLSPVYWKELKLAPDVIKTVVAEEWEERINTVSGTLLGLTVACARCHDHKFDPISQKDYYALAGVFASTRLAARPLLPVEEAKRVLAAREQVKSLEAEAKRLEQAASADAARAEELRRQARAAQARAEELKRATPHYDAPTAYAVEGASLDVLPDGPNRTRLDYRPGIGQDVAMQLRGNPAKPGPVVPRRFLTVLSRGEPVPFTSGSGRRELADAVFHDGAPLAARVIVNRVWKHHFGRGLVETPSNFGIQGDRPSHPELLDDLAARFIQAGWSLKWLHREIVLSATYRQSSECRIRPGEEVIHRLHRFPQIESERARTGRVLAGHSSHSVPNLRESAKSVDNPGSPDPRQAARSVEDSGAPAPRIPQASDAQSRQGFPNLRKSAESADNPGHPPVRTPQSKGLPNPQSAIRIPQSFAGMPRRRLEVEAWRDAILSAAGTLDRRVGGAPEELSTPGYARRTLYGLVKRRDLDDLLRLYDFPDPTAHSPARFDTTTPLQGLYVLNSEFIRSQAAALGARVRAEVPDDFPGQLRRAYLLLYSRQPSDREVDSARRFLGQAAGQPPAEAWNQLMEVLLARGELAFVD